MGTPVYVTLLVAAIAGVVALSVGWFARITARDIAALTANQKRRDVRIKALGAYVDLLMSAAAATQAYVWYASLDVRTTDAARPFDSAVDLEPPRPAQIIVLLQVISDFSRFRRHLANGFHMNRHCTVAFTSRWLLCRRVVRPLRRTIAIVNVTQSQ
jgi:hypothetical protein